MTRELSYEDTVRVVKRDGVTYQFTRAYTPAKDHYGQHFPASVEILAQRRDGNHWTTLHRITWEQGP